MTEDDKRLFRSAMYNLIDAENQISSATNYLKEIDWSAGMAEAEVATFAREFGIVMEAAEFLVGFVHVLAARGRLEQLNSKRG